MTVLPSTKQSTDWVALAECPDCHSPLELREASLRCTACRREFRAVGAGYDLLPLGVEGPADTAAPTGRGLRGSFIANIYTRHNRSRSVVAALRRVLSTLGPDDWGLNLGSANSRLHPRLLNLDVRANDNIHVLGTAECLPFQEDSPCCVGPIGSWAIMVIPIVSRPDSLRLQENQVVAKQSIDPTG